MKQKAFSIVLKGLSLKQMIYFFFLEGENLALKKLTSLFFLN